MVRNRINITRDKNISVAVFISNAHHFGVTGPQKVGITLTRNLLNRGAKIFLISNSPKYRIPRTGSFNKYLQILIIPGEAKILSYIRSLHLILRVLKEFKPNIIHGHGLFSAVLVVLLGKILKTPTVQTVYDVRVTSSMPRNILSFGLFFADHIICLSNFIENYLISAGISARKITVLPYGVENVWFDSNKTYVLKQKRIVMFWGDANFNRGFDTLLNAIPEVLKSHPDVKFAFAIRNHEGIYEEKIKEISKIYPDAIDLPSYKHVSEVVSIADIIVLPYNVTTMQPPFTLVESLLLGKAVITTDVEANRELIGKNERGILIKRGDSKQLAKAIVDLLSNDEKRNKIATKARCFVYELYHWDKVLGKILYLYRTIVQARS